ncbi:MAG: hypothetical protein NTY98_23770, partial [Verrucomicrobia bacterium]|nr:hypothetical protein [Verrucomicrobiota bacterium]
MAVTTALDRFQSQAEGTFYRAALALLRSMLFNSLSFLLLFLPVAWIGHQVAARAGHQHAI